MSAGIQVSGLAETRTFLAAVTGQLSYANALGQNRTIFRVWDAAKDQMRADLDRPTPWSIGALSYERKDYRRASTKARVWFKDRFGSNPGYGAEDYLGVHIIGGRRTRRRRSERHFQQIGIMPRGYTWVPAAGVRLDRYGNVSGRTISAIMQNRRGRYVFADTGRGKGVFDTAGGGWRPIIWFIPAPDYEARYRFYERSDAEIERHLLDDMGTAIDRALETANR